MEASVITISLFAWRDLRKTTNIFCRTDDSPCRDLKQARPANGRVSPQVQSAEYKTGNTSQSLGGDGIGMLTTHPHGNLAEQIQIKVSAQEQS